MNRFRFALLATLACLSIAMNSSKAGESAPFEFKAGDRVVLIGGSFIEQDQKYGYLEALLTVSHANKHLIFRNLGWSGDTVRGAPEPALARPKRVSNIWSTTLWHSSLPCW